MSLEDAELELWYQLYLLVLQCDPIDTIRIFLDLERKKTSVSEPQLKGEVDREQTNGSVHVLGRKG